MATERQILANRQNASRSTGPSERAKIHTRMNAVKHGMAGELAEVEAGLSPEFQQRRARWAAEQQPVGEAGNFALDRVVAATFLIERCEKAVNNVITSVQQRAKHTWDQDRAIEAATILGRLAKDPVLASCQLQATLAGVYLLIEAWLKLGAALEDADWTEAERSKALDLLGVAPDLRSGLTPVDSDGTDSVAYRRALVLEEVDRLKAFRDEALTPIDTLDRQHAMQGDVALLSKPAKLLMRYERDAWRHYDKSMKEVQATAVSPLPLGEGPGLRGVEIPVARDGGSPGRHQTCDAPHPGPRLLKSWP